MIELLVVIAIIGILVTTLVPKLREQLAKGKNAKAISLLGSARTAEEVMLVEKIVIEDMNKNNYILISLDEIKNKLDKKSNDIFKKNGNGNILVGSILDKNDKIHDDWKIYLFGTDDNGGTPNKLITGTGIGNKNKLRISGDEAELNLMAGISNAKKMLRVQKENCG